MNKENFRVEKKPHQDQYYHNLKKKDDISCKKLMSQLFDVIVSYSTWKHIKYHTFLWCENV